jgi:elongation factor 1-gamma
VDSSIVSKLLANTSLALLVFLGASGDSIISGTLILRGQDVKPVIEVAPDWESYAYVKLDLKGNEEDKKFFEAALAWDLEIDGKKWVDGKNVSWIEKLFLFY